MVDKNMIKQAVQIDSVETDHWYQTAKATPNITELAAPRDNGGRAECALQSIKEGTTLFWLSTSSEAWRLVVTTDYAPKFSELIQTLGISNVLDTVRTRQ